MKILVLSGGEVALVDDEDFDRLSLFSWRFDGRYAIGRLRTGYRGMRHGVTRSVKTYMHREVLGDTGGLDVDHINMDTLDNQKSNLRLESRSANMANSGSRGGTSKYKGVHWVKDCHKWRAAITVSGRTIVVGKFKDEVDAATAYNFAALEYFGEFARMNV